MYRDDRILGFTKWHSSPPPDYMMRLPDAIRDAVCFIAVKMPSGNLRFGGTGFFVTHEDETAYGPHRTLYLVTAKHCVEQAIASSGSVYARINLSNGTTKTVQLHGPWIKSDSDVAMMVIDDDDEYGHLLEANIPTQAFLTDAQIQQNNFGVGDEVYITGLFTQRFGISSNIPVLRSGIVSAMPVEPIQGPKDAKPFSAYLLEVRSLSGLSGSPVLTIIHRGTLMNRPARQFSGVVHQITLVGLIRGHWPTMANWDSDDPYIPADGDILNSGIALATPVQELRALIDSPEATAMRLNAAKDAAETNAPVLDSDFSAESSLEEFTKSDFEDALRKVSRKIDPPKPS